MISRIRAGIGGEPSAQGAAHLHDVLGPGLDDLQLGERVGDFPGFGRVEIERDAAVGILRRIRRRASHHGTHLQQQTIGVARSFAAGDGLKVDAEAIGFLAQHSWARGAHEADESEDEFVAGEGHRLMLPRLCLPVATPTFYAEKNASMSCGRRKVSSVDDVSRKKASFGLTSWDSVMRRKRHDAQVLLAVRPTTDSNYFVYPDDLCERCWRVSLRQDSAPAR